MVVFDDVQEDDTDLAAYVRRAFLPYSDDGSKILVTTRSETIADTWLEGSSKDMYKLRPLPSDKAFELFCKKTFRNSTGTCPPNLDNFARRLVTKCGGLPPAIISLARLLSSKKNDISEWEKVEFALAEIWYECFWKIYTGCREIVAFEVLAQKAKQMVYSYLGAFAGLRHLHSADFHAMDAESSIILVIVSKKMPQIMKFY